MQVSLTAVAAPLAPEGASGSAASSPKAPPDMALQADDVFRLTASLFADEIARRTKRSVAPQELATWTADTLVDEDGIGLDSLARLDAAIRLNQFFHLHEVGLEDYLLLEKTLGGWCAIIAKSLGIQHERITFQTSGSTGEPETCTHELRDLAAEISAQAPLYEGVERIVSLVPPHHIFGFLTTVLLPPQLDVPVVDARAWGPGAWNRDLQSGDLVVATPFHWDLLVKGLRHLPEGVYGLTSTAPMPMALKTKLLGLGLARLTELYGSSQTAGLGWRVDADEAFTLFDHLTRDGDAILRTDDAARGPLPLQDHLEWMGERRFVPAGRLDKAVQIGGVNVHPAKVETMLRAVPGVKEAAVRLAFDGADGTRAMLDAFIVPAAGAPDSEALIDQLHRACVAALPAVERPARFTLGEALPVNAMGKRRGW